MNLSETLLADRQIEKLITDMRIKNIGYGEFDLIKYIADGGTCQVKKALWTNGSSKKYVVLKSVNAKSYQELARESFLDCQVNGSYMVVLECAELGDLRIYLKEKSTEITWKEKIDISRQVSNGLDFLHSNEILHRDLHTRNILLSISDGKIRAIITDFGMSKVLSRESVTFSTVKGMIPFVDPVILNE
ncbi:3479_t:CDS:2, partial [Acaulospora morrowiae]